ncbi:SUR7/PalI family-domain-containing protein [Apiospora rasikravindrae]|uniref:SUR7/PalI family-domain-containing protein n=1 Tax=Apiospora rasikravindrae TaxID=990691 RepID=A0ABR1UAE9_9PEZI
MSIGTFFHHIGTFFALAAFALLIVPDVTAPSVPHLSLYRTTSKYYSTRILNYAAGNPMIDFGSFGYCVRIIPEPGEFRVPAPEICYSDGVGYSPADAINGVFRLTRSERIDRDVSRGAARLTKTFVLIPLATAAAGAAFLLALLSSLRPSRWASILAVAVSALASCLALVAFVCGIVAFAAVRAELEDGGTSVRAYYGVGMWALLAAMVCSLLGSGLIFFTCCSGRKYRSKDAHFAKAG